MTVQPGQHSRAYKLKNSLYITAFTEWFLGFFGRSAQFILIVTTIYQGAALLPGVTLPPGLNNAVFIIQMLTLDIGGMGLARIAKQAQDGNDPDGAAKAFALSKWLIRIVITTLVVSAIELTVKTVVTDTTILNVFNATMIGVSASLTIARAVCAVQYGQVMHSLKEEHEHQVPDPPLDFQALLTAALEKQASEQKQTLDLFRVDQQRLLGKVQSIENSVPAIDHEALIEAVTSRLASRFEAQIEALSQAVVRQKVSIREAHEAPQIEAPKPRREAPSSASPSRSEASAKVLTLRQPGTNPTDKRSLVYTLMEQEETLSSYEISARTSIPVSTVQRYMKDRKEQRLKEVSEAECEANGTEE